MKYLLSVVLVLSLIFMVSAQQCNTNAVFTCTQDFANMISGVTDPAELQRITREFCQSTCVRTTIPACSSLDPSVQAAVDRLMQACRSLPNGAPSVGSSIIALLSSIVMAGFAAVFF